MELLWHNPYGEKGGLGFSSAQFNILYAYKHIMEQDSLDDVKPFDIWRSFRSLKFEGCMPSGADVIGQWIGGLGIFEQDPLSVETLSFHLPDLEILVLRAGKNFYTYSYLRELKLKDLTKLKAIAHEACEALKDKKEERFLQAINSYRDELINLEYVADKSLKLLEKLKNLPEVKACKSCGAMGSETLIVFYNKEDEEVLKQKIDFAEIISDSSQTSYGVEFQKITK